jgi:dTDP-4-amino-4,6-dideoxygalactose transaminase
MKIPFVDLHGQYLTIRSEIDAAIDRVVSHSAYIGGQEVQAFEREFASFCMDRSAIHLYCASCANGTDALYLTLRARGIGPGDEVITVAHTFIATAEAIALTGAHPVFVDILPDTLLMNPELLNGAITPRTRAVVPVHLYGQPCDMTRIVRTAKEHDLFVVEDAAQAHGARWGGQRVGGLGDAACFSFYPGKNLGAYGDGGAVVSADGALIEKIRMLANHGRKEKYVHELAGVNSRLDAMQAAILRAKLPHLDAWNAARRKHAASYIAALRDSPLDLPAVHPETEPVWHLFVCQVPDRVSLQQSLREAGIESGVHYPLPLHLQPAFRHLNIPAGSLPLSEYAADRVLSLPMFPDLTPNQVSYVAEMVRAHLNRAHVGA